jgi:hypothetical protein
MKKIFKPTALFLLLLSFLFSCEKDKTGDTGTEIVTTPPQNSKWVFNGVKYAGLNPSWAKLCSGSVYMIATTKVGDTTIFCDIEMPAYLPSSGKYCLYTYNYQFPYATPGVVLKLVKQIGNTYYENHVSTFGYADSVLLKDDGDLYRISCHNISLLENYNPYKIKPFSCDITFKKPKIPAENAAYTVPAGIEQNRFKIDNHSVCGINCNSFTITNYGGYLKSTFTGSAGSMTFHFGESMPPSGTYNIISDYDLKPGKVFIECLNPDPLSAYISAAGGTATVVNTPNKFAITISNVTFNRISTAGNPTISVTGNANF